MIDDDDDDLLYSVMRVTDTTLTYLQQYIDEHPSEGGMLISSVNYASQLKRGRALLRLRYGSSYRDK